MSKPEPYPQSCALCHHYEPLAAEMAAPGYEGVCHLNPLQPFVYVRPHGIGEIHDEIVRVNLATQVYEEYWCSHWRPRDEDIIKPEPAKEQAGVIDPKSVRGGPLSPEGHQVMGVSLPDDYGYGHALMPGQEDAWGSHPQHREAVQNVSEQIFRNEKIRKRMGDNV